MRFVVLLFGLLACTVTTLLGLLLFFPDESKHEVRAYLGGTGYSAIQPLLEDREAVKAGLFLLIGGVLGLCGTMLSLFRCGWQGSLLLFIPIIGPAVLSPLTLVATSPQALVALLSLFVGPLPTNAPQEDVVDDE